MQCITVHQSTYQCSAVQCSKVQCRPAGCCYQSEPNPRPNSQNVPTALHPAHCTVHTASCTLHCAHYTLHTVPYTVLTAHFTLPDSHNIQCCAALHFIMLQHTHCTVIVVDYIVFCFTLHAILFNTLHSEAIKYLTSFCI